MYLTIKGSRRICQTLTFNVHAHSLVEVDSLPSIVAFFDDPVDVSRRVALGRCALQGQVVTGHRVVNLHMVVINVKELHETQSLDF